jgi:hypothetical protein
LNIIVLGTLSHVYLVLYQKALTFCFRLIFHFFSAHHSELGGTWPNDHDTDDIRAGYDTITDILAGWLNEITSKQDNSTIS